jgi:RND superfamily putative drug exporter
VKLSTETLARASARHPWRAIVAWLLAMAAAIAAVVLLLGDGLTSEGYVTNDPDSLEAYRLIEERFPATNAADELVVVRSDEVNVDAPAFREKVEQLHRELEAAPAVDDVSSYVDTQEPGLVSAGGEAALLRVRLGEDGEDGIERVIGIVEGAGDGRFATAITGEFTLDRDFGEISQRDLENGELRFGLPAALIVLVLVFGALVAAGLPLVLALVSIAVALGLTALVSAQWELSLFVVNMLTGMGLALGIDYALFVVSRFREERGAGREKIDAIAATGATASRAVLFSGSAFVLAMLGLLLVQSNIMRSLAAGAILVGIVSVVAALTLLPALLSLLGDGVDRLRLPLVGRRAAPGDDAENRFWGAIVRRVIRRPALSFALAAAALVAAAIPVLGINIGAAGITTLPDDTVSKQGFVALAQSFRTTSSDPVQIVLDGDLSSPELQVGLANLTAAVQREGQFGPPALTRSADDEVALLTVPIAGDPLGERAVAAVRELRAETIPAAFEGSDARVLVTGTTAENIDYFDVMEFWLPIVIVFVLGLSFVLLTVAFRSIVVPATAIVLNLLSVGATYGLVVAVFQHGIGNDLLGFQQVDVIEAWVPLFLFAVLFGLSMDYQVFLLSRIRERYSETGDTAGAVAFGIGSTGRIITGAALIIVAVFAGFAAGDLVMFQQMGFGIAVALLVDATIVRSILVPAAMTLLGRWNWYLPRWLDWLPHIEVEAAHPDTPQAADQDLTPARST